MLRAEISLASTSVERTLEIIDNHGPRPRQATAAADLDRCSRSYRLPDGRLLHIQRDHDTLALVAPAQDALTLVPAGERQWTAQSVSATVTLEYDRDPMPARLILHQEAMYVEDVEAARVA